MEGIQGVAAALVPCLAGDQVVGVVPSVVAFEIPMPSLSVRDVVGTAFVGACWEEGEEGVVVGEGVQR